MMIMILRTSSYKYPVLQQCSMCSSARCAGAHASLHTCARRATAWGRTPDTFGVSIEGPEREWFTNSSGTQEAAAGAEEHQLPSDSSV